MFAHFYPACSPLFKTVFSYLPAPANSQIEPPSIIYPDDLALMTNSAFLSSSKAHKSNRLRNVVNIVSFFSWITNILSFAQAFQAEQYYRENTYCVVRYALCVKRDANRTRIEWIERINADLMEL